MKEARLVGRDPWEEAAALQTVPQQENSNPALGQLLVRRQPSPQRRKKVFELQVARPSDCERVPDTGVELTQDADPTAVSIQPQPPLPRS